MTLLVPYKSYRWRVPPLTLTQLNEAIFHRSIDRGLDTFRRNSVILPQ